LTPIFSGGADSAGCYSSALIGNYQSNRGAKNHLAANPARNIAGRDSSDELLERSPELQRGPSEAPQDTLDTAEALSLARRIVELAADKLASEIVLLDIRGVSLIADYFVICSAGSERQTTAILKDLSDKLIEEFGRKPLHTEGKGDSGWVLLDYGDVIVHVFSPAQRTFYNLEQLWSTATPIVRLQ
jgi:ribosome-associated protein